MEQFLNVMGNIHKQGNKRMDRTGTGTSAIFGPQMSFNLSYGELPMVTTKKMFTRGIIEELNWIIDADTNAQTLQDKNVHIWDEWALTAEDIPEGSAFRPGDLGPIYPAMWRRIPVGLSHNWIQVEEREGLEATEVLEADKIKPVYCPSQPDTPIGWLGKNRVDQDHPLYFAWYIMCQDAVARGPVVCDRWSVFANFEKDAAKLPYYEQWCVDPTTYVLTCGYHNGSVYHPRNTVFATRENKRQWSNSNGYELWQVKTKSGVHHTIDLSISVEPGDSENLGSLMAKKGMIWRREYYIDQIAQVMESLSNKKGSRRHIVTAWVPEFLPNETISPKANVLNGKAALAECHCMFQFYVENVDDANLRYLMWDRRINRGAIVGKDKEIYHDVRETPLEPEQDYTKLYHQRLHKFLDEQNFPRERISCKMIQRSADVALGVPFNITSYAILTLMFADQLDMIPGDFIHSFGDTHIYSNHNDKGQIDEQLSRTPLSLPTVSLKPVKDIYSYTVDDIVIEGYEHHPAISFKISV